MLCLVAVYFGAEFGYVTSQTNDTYSILTGRNLKDTEIAVLIDDNSILETALDKIGIDTSSMKESRLAEEREEIRKSGSQDLRRIKGGSRGFLSRVNTKTLSVICMILVVTFAAYMVYSHYVPNTGEGITDYKAYKESSDLNHITVGRHTENAAHLKRL